MSRPAGFARRFSGASPAYATADSWTNPRDATGRRVLQNRPSSFQVRMDSYVKGSLSIDLILGLFNIDPAETARKLG
jgi:hypothetical protein